MAGPRSDGSNRRADEGTPLKNDDQAGDFRSLVRQIQQSDGDRETGAPSGSPRVSGRRTLIVREFDRPTRRPGTSATSGPVTPESGFRAARPAVDAEPRPEAPSAPRPTAKQTAAAGMARPGTPVPTREAQPVPRRNAVPTVFGVPGRGPFLLSQRWL